MGKKYLVCAFCLLLLLGYPLVTLAAALRHATVDAPGVELEAPAVKALMGEQPSAVLINLLSEVEHMAQHIPGSINLPINQLMRYEDALPEDRDTPLIFYCMGPR